MSYTAPVAAEFKARFPKFDTVADATIDAFISEALGWVSDEWVTQDDYTMGAMLYAAHLLTLDGFGSGAESELASAGLLGFKSITSGKLSVSRDTGVEGGNMASETVTQTQYGRRYAELRLRNISGARII